MPVMLLVSAWTLCSPRLGEVQISGKKYRGPRRATFLAAKQDLQAARRLRSTVKIAMLFKKMQIAAQKEKG